PVADRGAEHCGDPAVDDLDGRRRQFVGQLCNQRLNLALADRGDGTLPDRGIHVQSQVTLDRLGRARTVDLNRPPLFSEALEGDLAGGRIDVVADELGVLDRRKEPLGVDPTVEGLRPFPSVRGPITSSPSTGSAFLDMRHAAPLPMPRLRATGRVRW